DLRHLIVLAVFLALVLVLVGRRRMLTSIEKQLVRLGPVQISLLFLVGIWAGLIVLDSYTYLLIVLVLGAGYGLVRANALKAVAGIAMTVASLLVFAQHGEVDWKAGAIMSLGSMTGAWLGALIASNERSRVWVFRVLIVTIVAELIYMVTTR
ncbi:MAG TPA: sulfite exporter TauE/SafE family protein, partial [Phycisphaerae bacterium]|nr:sulfite exporter TauE/SafE family protein [Phycisphaerae bacterium]